MIYALLSWYDEKPEHLRRCVMSLKGFADVLVAVDGAYTTFPDAKPESPSVQHGALSDAARAAGLRPFLVTLEPCSEVVKRAEMFQLAREAGATADDWLLVIDGDESLAEVSPDARDLLAATDRDVAELRYERVQVDGVVCGTTRERRLYRALPGLTVERAHFLYTVPTNGVRVEGALPRRFLWRRPDGHLADERILDLFGHVTMHHRNSSREPSRRQRALDYYRERDTAGLEAIGRDWTGLGALA